MKYELLVAAILLLVGTASAEYGQDEVVAVDPDTVVGEGEDVVHYWGADNVDEHDGTGDIIIHPDDEWEAVSPLGNSTEWDPNDETTRDGTGTGGNAPDQDFILPELGDEEVIPPAIQVFQGRYASESLATEHGRGGGARGHARGRGRENLGKRNLRAKPMN